MTPASVAAAFAVAVVVIVVAFLVLATYNAVVDLRLRIDKAWSNIDVALKQRFDQLPNLVDAVRGVNLHDLRLDPAEGTPLRRR